GTLINAPVHVELDARAGVTERELAGSVQVDRTPAAIRPAAQLVAVALDRALAARDRAETEGPAQGALRPATVGPAAPPAEREQEREREREPSGARGSGSAANPAHVVATPAIDPHPDLTIAAAVKACTLSKLAPGDLRVVVSTRLTLRVGEDGAVVYAR